MTHLTDMPVIVVLGAPNDDHGRLLPSAQGRTDAAVHEYERNPASRLVLTGGFGPHFNTTSQPHFHWVATVLRSRGIPPSAILTGLLSINTQSDAQMTAEYLSQRQGPLHLKVVTSDYHVARARLLFTRAFPSATTIEMVAAPAMLPLADLQRALIHEAEAIARLAGTARQ